MEPGTCRFVSDGEYYGEDPRKRLCRLLEVCFLSGNGRGKTFPVLVTADEDTSFSTATGTVHDVWHYAVKDGKITLTAKPSSSVKVLGAEGQELAHDTITDWPLEESAQ